MQHWFGDMIRYVYDREKLILLEIQIPDDFGIEERFGWEAIGLSDGRRHGNNARRCFVVGTTVGPAARIGAGECDEEREKEGKNLSHKCLVNGVLSARAGSRFGAGNA